MQDKRFGRVYMNKKWGSCEGGLQRLKGIFNFNSLRKRLILLNHMNMRGDYRGIMCNELSIEIGKPKKMLNILNRSSGSLIHNGLNLIRVHVNAISKNNITQEFHLRLMESTLFQFGIRTNLSKLCQNKICMVLMVCHVLQKNKDVVNVLDHKIIQILMEDIIYHMLKDNRCIDKVKRHHNVLKMVVTSFEHHFPFITFSNAYQVVCSM